ncbi:MAG: hypothetical protein HN909_02990 [Phycisphaerales bacterium]|jgi:hypothetical protein|nr:hypothetical protein [Phycisphaerales bacterium]MBT7170718.1 hypothetical protein [Phycisphaerales bacterium]
MPNIQRISRTVCGLLLLLMASAAMAETDVLKLWQEFRRYDPDPGKFMQTQNKLKELVAKLPEAQRVPVAASLMRRGGSDAEHMAALQLFGKAGLSAKALAPILANVNRTWPERILIRTYYRFCLPENTTLLTETSRREMLTLLTARMTTLGGAKAVGYGEQRFATHMLQPVLARYGGQEEDCPEMLQLRKAMQAYVNSGKKDMLATSIEAWLTMIVSPKIDSVDVAVKYLGHWDPVVRNVKAASYLAMKLQADPKVALTLERLMADPTKGGDIRDEVRAAAATVYSFMPSYMPRKVIPEMVRLLMLDKGVLVQQAARGTLVAMSDEAQVAIDQIITAMEVRTPKAGPKRTDNILETLSYLVFPSTPRSQKDKLLNLALANMDYAPGGALGALEALGSHAKSALPKIVQYRDTKADRMLRQRINRHVIHAIDPEYDVSK